MEKSKINSPNFAKRLGAYSHGYKITIGNTNLIFSTGQVALDKNGDVVSPNDPSVQTEFIYSALKTILQEAGATLDDVVKTTVFVTNMNDFAKISRVRDRYLKNSEPVSTLVEVNRLVKPGCVVEIEVIAAVKI